jgi:pimeloyl-ACP methyl ester carboxylesterase
MLPEIVSARHGLVRGLLFAAVHATRVLTHMFSPLLMARRVEMIRGVSLHDELAPLRLPTLVITGDHRLDRVVPVSMTREYLKMWPHASFAVIARSGHLGLITRADEFAALVGGFAGAASDARVEGRRVG